MAIFGTQLVFSVIVAFLISRFSGTLSFGRWILCRKLARFLHPTDEELKKLAGQPINQTTHKSNKKHDTSKKNKDEPFTVPRSIDIQLEAAQIKSIDLIPLQFYTEYLWLVDVAVCGVIVYVLTDTYYFFLSPTKEMNLSILWCLVIIAFSLKNLLSLTGIYFKSETGGEMILCILFGFFFLVFAMGVLIVDENTLEFGLTASYDNFSTATKSFLLSQGLEPVCPISLNTIKIFMAVICAIIGAFFTFPGLRLAKMHVDALRYAKDNISLQFFLYTNFISALVVSLLWVKPLFRDYLVHKRWRNSEPLMNDNQFEALRLFILLLFVAFRFCMIWTHLQAHLNLAVDKVAELKKEVGRISSLELKKMVIRVYYYLCIVALQYITPLIIILFSTLLLKTLANVSIPHLLFKYDLPPTFNYSIPLQKSPTSINNMDSMALLITTTAQRFSEVMLGIKCLLSPSTFFHLASFFTWWTVTAWFATHAFGVLYHVYFNE